MRSGARASRMPAHHARALAKLFSIFFNIFLDNAPMVAYHELVKITNLSKAMDSKPQSSPRQRRLCKVVAYYVAHTQCASYKKIGDIIGLSAEATRGRVRRLSLSISQIQLIHQAPFFRYEDWKKALDAVPDTEGYTLHVSRITDVNGKDVNLAEPPSNEEIKSCINADCNSSDYNGKTFGDIFLGEQDNGSGQSFFKADSVDADADEKDVQKAEEGYVVDSGKLDGGVPIPDAQELSETFISHMDNRALIANHETRLRKVEVRATFLDAYSHRFHEPTTGSLKRLTDDIAKLRDRQSDVNAKLTTYCNTNAIDLDKSVNRIDDLERRLHNLERHDKQNIILAVLILIVTIILLLHAL